MTDVVRLIIRKNRGIVGQSMRLSVYRDELLQVERALQVLMGNGLNNHLAYEIVIDEEQPNAG